MKKVAIVTDSNAGIRQEEAKELGFLFYRCLLLLMIKHIMKISI